MFAAEHGAARLEKAKRALDKAQALAPDLPEVHRAKAYWNWYVERDSASAMREFETVLNDQPNNSESLYDIGAFLMNQGAVVPALQYITRVYELDPTNNYAFFAAACNFYMRRFEQTERWGNIIVSKDPASWTGYRWKFRAALYGFGEIEKARRLLEEYLGATTERSDVFEMTSRFQLAYFVRDYKEALRILNAGPALERNSELIFDLTLHYPNLQRSYLYNLLGEVRKGRACLDSAITESKNDTWLESGCSARGLIYAMQGKREEALHELAKALHPGAKAFNWGRESEHRAAQIWIALGEHERAIDELEYLLSVPSEVTRTRLRLDPIYDPLRSNPRFQALLAKDY